MRGWPQAGLYPAIAPPLYLKTFFNASYMTNDTEKAKYYALTNAAEFIRQHGEEGGLEEDTFPFHLRLYLNQKLRVAAMLERIAAKLHKQINWQE